MEIKDVIELIQAVSDNGLTGFKIEQGDTKIVIKKEQPAVIQAVPALAGCQPADGAVTQTVQTVSGMPLNGSQGSPARRRIRLYLTGLLPVLWWERFIPLRLQGCRGLCKCRGPCKKGRSRIRGAMKLMNEDRIDYDGVEEASL